MGVVCLVFEFISEAKTLAAFLENPPSDLSRSDIADVLSGITSGLQRMHSNQLWHNDLHDDNILIRTIADDENLSARFEPKLIDFGSVLPAHVDQPESPSRSDYAYLAKHIYAVVQAFERVNWGKLKNSDRAFCAALRTLAHRIADQNVSRRSLTPSQVQSEIKRALTDCANGKDYPTFSEMLEDKQKPTLPNPLDKSNALNLYPQDVAMLFRDSLGWESRVEKSEPVLIVGPRGCGKTMLLRYLSIASAARPQKKELEAKKVAARLAKMKRIGFLVSGVKMRTPFFRSNYRHSVTAAPNETEDFCREYFNLNFAFEVLRTLVWLSSEELIPLSQDELSMIASSVGVLLPDPTIARSGDINRVGEAIDRRIMQLSAGPVFGEYAPTDFCSDEVLHKLAQVVRRTHWGAMKEVWFLLDDYSVTVVPEFAQRAYNPVLFRLSTEARIKISSEGDGPILSDSLDRKYREGREISKVNLGEVYFQKSEGECRSFFEDILEARFSAAGNGSLEDLKARLGEHEHEKAFGRYLMMSERPGDARFHGFGLICQLCSGDVSFVIELLEKLDKLPAEGRLKKVSPKAQDEVIKSFAQRQLMELRAIAEHGTKLHDFALQLGTMLRGMLQASKGERLDERLRIEISGSWTFKSPAAQLFHDALLRHSVLIPFGAGKDREGQPCRRLYFRRLFAPCFPFSPNRRGSIALTMKTYEQWLANPQSMNEKGASQRIAHGKHSLDLFRKSDDHE